jgi:pimeloyl-ACP methyl ester carboxylesterase
MILHSFAASCDEHTPLPAFPAHARLSAPDRRGHCGSPVWPVAADVVVVACGGTLPGARPHRTLAAVAAG